MRWRGCVPIGGFGCGLLLLTTIKSIGPLRPPRNPPFSRGFPFSHGANNSQTTPRTTLDTWPRGVTVNTLDSESSDRGSNPRGTCACQLATVMSRDVHLPACCPAVATRIACKPACGGPAHAHMPLWAHAALCRLCYLQKFVVQNDMQLVSWCNGQHSGL